MNFASSTHKQRWLFSRDQLLEVRRKTHEASTSAAVERSKRLRMASDLEGTNQPDEDGSSAVTPDDECKLLRFYSEEILKLCSRMKYPTKVKAAAVVYLKRFYLYNSCINYPPTRIMLTCIYLAGKIEEFYIGAEDFCRSLNQDPKAVLNNEVPLLQGLQFDLIVHSPYRALAGLFEDLRRCREQQSPDVDAAICSSSPEALELWRASATSAVDALMLSDAPLRHPPGQLALAALRSGAKAHGVRLVAYLEHAARRALEFQAGGGPEVCDGAEDSLRQLLSALDDIDRLGMEGAQKVDIADVQAIDKRLIAHRNLGDPDAAKAASAAADQEKAERREAKLKARRQQQAAAETRVLGMTQIPQG